MSGPVEDLADAVKRGAGKLRERADEELTRLKERYEEERRKKIVNLLLFVGIAYLLWREV